METFVKLMQLIQDDTIDFKARLETANKVISYCEKACFDIESPCYRCSNKGGRYTRENGGIRYE